MALSTLAKTFDKFSDINSSKSSWNIKGKVLRLWVVKDFNRNEIPFSVEMIIMDYEGQRIHCSIRKTLLYKLQNEVKEIRVYAFDKLDVATNGGSYKTTKHQYKFNFRFDSKVQALDPSKLSNISPFKFVPIAEIISGSYDTDYLVDKLLFDPY
ncbi:hypothetical protein P8452_04248 [Trifolium repens]|nr:hypothetical protein P8452_04248 [Trifolium repens]